MQNVEHVLGKYIISDQPMTEEQRAAERATIIDEKVVYFSTNLSQILRSMQAERAVEPTKSENITVTWRRSASVRGAGGESPEKPASVYWCRGQQRPSEA